MGQPVANRALRAALERDFDQAGIMAVKAAKKMDGVSHVAAGMPADSFKQRCEVRMARGTAACDPGELGRGNTDRFLFG
ncbi:MAG TPA: hypothetical protein VH392_08385, partial [Sphingomicrobium sp.]